MKKKHKILFGVLVLTGCLLFGCEKRKTELFAEEKQDMVDAGQSEPDGDGDTVFTESGERKEDFQESGETDVKSDIEGNGDSDFTGSVVNTDPVSGILNAAGQQKQDLQDGGQVDENQSIFVHVCGAVKNPGVYELAEEMRVYQAVEAAGGFLPEACEEYVNQAGMLTDGRRLYIPTRDEVSRLEASGEDMRMAELLLQPEGETDQTGGGQDSRQNKAPTEETAGLVNINTASLEELCTLPGIGEGKAVSIISYRESTGRFEQIEDIMKVEGIKEGLFGKIRDLITA